ncbi:nucleotide exchange factor GrpE [Persephonella sp.]
MSEEKKEQEVNVDVEVEEGKSEESVESLKEEIENLKKKLEKTEEAAKKLSVLYQNLQKEFEDYKIRVRREKEEAKEEGVLKIAKGLMEIVDNFEKAVESVKTATDLESVVKGIKMIHYQLEKFLKDHGIEKIYTEGEFNPLEHEAVETIQSKEYKQNQIVKVLQSGYRYKGKVIRPAKVIVAIPPEERDEIT